jgi:hypothetical protein
MGMGEARFWYNVRTGQVESDDERSPVKDLLGPFGTREEAARALDIVRERNAAWDAEDDW